jgi:hypothetical protein
VVTNTLKTPYDTTTKLVTSVPDNCVYWFQLSVGIPNNTKTNTRLNGLPYPVAVVTQNTAYPADVIVADTIQNVSTNIQLTVSNSLPVLGTFNTSNSSYIGTSLLGFRIDNLMSAQVYFSVQCTTSYSGNAQQIVFDRVLVNAGNAWNTTASKFQAPYTGNYFCSFAAAAPGSEYGGIDLYVNRAWKMKAYVYENAATYGHHNGIITVRGAAMMSMSTNDVLWFQSFQSVYNTTEGLTNAQGFYYSPAGGNATAVAWSVSRSTAFSGPISVLAHDTVFVNMKKVWNTTTFLITLFT